jgi:hypothetical protein
MLALNQTLAVPVLVELVVAIVYYTGCKLPVHLR